MELNKHELSSGTTLSVSEPDDERRGMETLPSATLFDADVEEDEEGGCWAVRPSCRVLIPRPEERGPVAVEMFGLGPPIAPNDDVAP